MGGARSVVIPFDGIPLVAQVLLTFAFLVIVAMCLWTVTLFVRGRRAIAGAPAASAHADAAWTWVFLVAALNEEITIADSVSRLLALDLANRKVIAIDDGSDDRTPEILATFSDPDLYVLRRNLPDARKGKAQALNAAYRCIGQRLPGVDRERVIVVVVDADGRIAPTAPHFAAAHFEDPEVGGVQALVRIYNRTGFLTQMQDVEFSVYGSVYQAGRNRDGTAGMGGNGQFNRLAALDAIVEGDGPWRNRLTEDQDLGLRLLAAGWKSRQEMRAVVEQQGVPRLRPLLRQRTRWAQGNLQALDLLGATWRSPFPRAARVGEVLYLLMPLWQAIAGAALAGAHASRRPRPRPDHPVRGDRAGGLRPRILELGARLHRNPPRRRPQLAPGDRSRPPLCALHLAPVPVLIRALARQIGTRREWARTDRVPLESCPCPGWCPEATGGATSGSPGGDT